MIGVDSSTQSCKVVVRDLGTGEVVRSATAPHPPGTEVDPEAWWTALDQALDEADGLGDDVRAIGVAGQQHGMVTLDDDGCVVRPALLWNDTRSAGAASALVEELGPQGWADAVGSVPVASFTVTKLRWLAEHEPSVAARVAAVCLPHDWLTWRLRATSALDELTTDRGDASGTGYWSPSTGQYRHDLLERAFGRMLGVPGVATPWAAIGETPSGVVVSAGTGDNMAAALALRARPGDVVVSLGTSGVVSAVSTHPTADPSGIVAGFADAAGNFLPLACTLNGAPVFSKVASLLGADLDDFAEFATTAPPGAEGLVLVPYFEGERTPNLPNAHAQLHGMTLANTTPANIARATIEGILCGLADALDVLVALGVTAERVLLVGGGARSAAVQDIAAAIFDLDVHVPTASEYVAEGAALQAAAALTGEPPPWPEPPANVIEAAPAGFVRDQYREAAEQVMKAAQ